MKEIKRMENLSSFKKLIEIKKKINKTFMILV